MEQLQKRGAPPLPPLVRACVRARAHARARTGEAVSLVERMPLLMGQAAGAITQIKCDRFASPPSRGR
jgi:hypothetical protein